jgi:hypothetical protein
LGERQTHWEKNFIVFYSWFLFHASAADHFSAGISPALFQQVPISLNEKYAPIEMGENDRFDIFGKSNVFHDKMVSIYSILHTTVTVSDTSTSSPRKPPPKLSYGHLAAKRFGISSTEHHIVKFDTFF